MDSMRVEAVNSYLSSISFMEHHPISAVGRGTESHIQEPQVKVPVKTVVNKILVDTIGKAQLPFDFVPPCLVLSKLTPTETNAIEGLIALERSRTDYVEKFFPGLLKV